MKTEDLRHPARVVVDHPTGLGWATLSITLALPWLLSTHTAPWTMFHSEWLMAAGMLPLAAWAVVHRPGPWAISQPVLVLALLALLPLLHSATGMLAYATDGFLGVLYLAGLALAAATGMRGEALKPNRVADTVFASLVIAALASMGLMLYQWMQFTSLGMLALPLPFGGRLVANLGQPNLLATMLVWGLLGLWWGFLRGRIGAGAGTAAAIFLLVGIAATQSRTGVAEVALLAVVALVGGRDAGQPRRWAVLVLLACFVIAVAAWPSLTAALQLESALSLEQQAATGRRPLIWALAIQLIAERPLFGWGWNQTAAAQIALFDSSKALHLVLPYMHNLGLDLVLWNGLPLGLLMTGSLLTWFVSRWRRHLPTQRPLLLALTVLLLHSMLELPHAYTLFLLPAGLMCGVLEHQFAQQTRALVPRTMMGGLILAIAVALAVIAVEYLRVENDLRDTRMRAARIGDLTPVAPPNLRVLVPFGDLLNFLRIEPTRGMDGHALDDMRRVAHRFPSGPNIFRYAQAAALNGRPEEARRELALLCHLMLPTQCNGANDAWREIARTRYPEMLVLEVPAR